MTTCIDLQLLRLAILALLTSLPTTALRADDFREVVRWEFSPETSDSLTAHGAILRDQAGPRPPTFPDFESNNTALRLADRGAFLTVADPGDHSDFDFDNGDAITLEAWVMPDISGKSALMNIVSKGRTGNPNFAKDNQNWALRLSADGENFHLGFLFASAQPGEAHWHRWTSLDSFAGDTGWHHIAVSYQFGKPELLRAWIDGKPTAGKWDMGGATAQPPIVDNDEIWIGNSGVNNQFQGYLDSIVIARGMLDDAMLAIRFHRVGTAPINRLAPAVMPELGALPSGSVLLSLQENFPKPDRWLNESENLEDDAIVWSGDSFLLPRIPQRFDAWGIRDAWKGPLLMRAATDMALPAGEHKVLLRVRGMSRLWLDGRLIAQTGPVTRRSVDGEQPVTPVTEPPAPGLRAAGYHQQEVVETFAIHADSKSASLKRMVLEVVVGGKGQRTETGEVLVALQLEGSSSWRLARPATLQPMSLDDEQIGGELLAIETRLADLDDHHRRLATASMNDYWQTRHQRAQAVAAELLPEAHALAIQNSSIHPIDQLIAAKIERAKVAAAENQSAEAKHFQKSVLPILRDECFRCHGDKQQGGLRLNTRVGALSAGDSEQFAVVPGKPDESELMAQVRSGAMPPTDEGLSKEQIAALEQWVREGAVWPAAEVSPEQIAFAPLVSDAAFVRRAFLDTIGLPPTTTEARAFLLDAASNKRQSLVQSLTADERTADHWMSFWQDLLAENPTLINQSMNSTGPFRWFLYDALRDRKPLDRMVTELILQRGSTETGGSAAFGLSGETDLPSAAKAHIIASGFLAIELQCAKCHDSPYHTTTQRDLYSIAAMMDRASVKVPKTSRVPAAFFEKKGRESLIKVTLPHDEPVAPHWPFAHVTGTPTDETLAGMMIKPEDSRERLAALTTAPENLRFTRVIVNRIWQRLMGAGIVEPLSDWEGRPASHPELLDYLAYELLTHGYRIDHVVQIIMTSDAYTREAQGHNQTATAELRFFNAPDRRRLTAEQIVDSLHHAVGRAMDCEELTFVHDGQRPLGARQTLGVPRRSWMLASLNNERDRPSLALPRAQTIVDVLEAFGWNGSRQSPVAIRESAPNVLQPGVMSNSTLVSALTRVAYDSELAKIAMECSSPSALVEEMFLRVLSRLPSDAERTAFEAELAEGFESRLVSRELAPAPTLPQLPLVTWFNHLQPDTTRIAIELEQRAKKGPPSDPRFDELWRSVFEDFVWSLMNHREFVWMP